jgi:hypothetical protein
VRNALGTLPWVEKGSIQTEVDSREVRFNLSDKTAFDEAAVRQALTDAGFPVVTVTSAPGQKKG